MHPAAHPAPTDPLDSSDERAALAVIATGLLASSGPTQIQVLWLIAVATAVRIGRLGVTELGVSAGRAGRGSARDRIAGRGCYPPALSGQRPTLAARAGHGASLRRAWAAAARGGGDRCAGLPKPGRDGS